MVWAIIEASPYLFQRLAGKYALNDRVQTLQCLVTPRNIEGIFRDSGVLPEFGVMSIDIDSQDWWIWRAITHYRPHVVIIEYNAGLPADSQLAGPEGPITQWTDTRHSLVRRLEHLGKALGEERATG